MQLKWLEDFLTLAEAGTLSRAAELRNVTHPAFGRRIQALESWAGTPLIERGRTPVQLTMAGVLFRDTAQQIVQGLEHSRSDLLGEAGRSARTVAIATGRTLARTVLANWLVQLQPLITQATIRILTSSLPETIQMLERHEAEFVLVNYHPALAIGLDGRQFAHITFTSDRLVPVSRAGPRGEPVHALAGKPPLPFLTYGAGLALSRLLEDHLANNLQIPPLVRRLECDSADALAEYVLKGLGIAWLPWSLVQGDCQNGRMALAGDGQAAIAYEVRLYRAKRRLGALAELIWQSALGR